MAATWALWAQNCAPTCQGVRLGLILPGALALGGDALPSRGTRPPINRGEWHISKLTSFQGCAFPLSAQSLLHAAPPLVLWLLFVLDDEVLLNR